MIRIAKVRRFIVQAAGFRHMQTAVYVAFLLLWFLIQFFLFRANGGAVTSVDSVMYIEDANKLLSGIIPEGRNFWYLGYTLFLSVVFYFGGGLQEAVLSQMLFSGIATACLYILTLEIAKDKLAASLAVLFYLFWVKTHQWNIFVYSESLFTSFGIISFTALVKSKRPWHYAVSTLLLLYTFFIRPSGFGFFVGLAIYIASLVQYRGLSRWAIASFGLLIAAGSTLLLNKMLEEYILVESYAKAEIIYPDISLGIVPPSDLFMPSESYPPLIRLLAFMVNNPLYFLKISLAKMGLFLGNVKPYFSWAHNTAIVLILYPLYFYAVKGYSRLSGYGRERYFIAGYFIAQTLTVTLTTENWDGRFLVPVLPFLFILSAAGIATIVRSSRLYSALSQS